MVTRPKVRVIRLPEELYQHARRLAFERHCTIQAVVAQAVEEHVIRQGSPIARISPKDARAMGFRVPDEITEVALYGTVEEHVKRGEKGKKP